MRRTRRMAYTSYNAASGISRVRGFLAPHSKHHHHPCIYIRKHIIQSQTKSTAKSSLCWSRRRGRALLVFYTTFDGVEYTAQQQRSYITHRHLATYLYTHPYRHSLQLNSRLNSTANARQMMMTIIFYDVAHTHVYGFGLVWLRASVACLSRCVIADVLFVVDDMRGKNSLSRNKNERVESSSAMGFVSHRAGYLMCKGVLVV